jgi:hypothetical protein
MKKRTESLIYIHIDRKTNYIMDIKNFEEYSSKKVVTESSKVTTGAEESLSTDAPNTKSKKFTDPNDKEGTMNVKKGVEVRTKITSFKDFGDSKKEQPLSNLLGKVSKDKDKTPKEGVAKDKVDKEVQA